MTPEGYCCLVEANHNRCVTICCWGSSMCPPAPCPLDASILLTNTAPVWTKTHEGSRGRLSHTPCDPEADLQPYRCSGGWSTLIFCLSKSRTYDWKMTRSICFQRFHFNRYSLALALTSTSRSIYRPTLDWCIISFLNFTLLLHPIQRTQFLHSTVTSFRISISTER